MTYPKRVMQKILRKNPFTYYELVGSIRNTLIERSSMILHIGAHKAQEASDYALFDKSVFWIEANPKFLGVIEREISKFPNKKPLLLYLVTKVTKK